MNTRSQIFLAPDQPRTSPTPPACRPAADADERGAAEHLLLLLAGGASALAALWARRGRTLRSRTISASAGIEGRLYAYRNSPGSLQAFESPAQHTSSKFCVYIGGLTDGLLACAYVPGLASCAENAGWALVQPIISSSYAGYGTGSLDRDAEELGVLLRYLVRERGATSFALIGHSTGCQDIVQFMKVADDDVRALVRVAVLQAPVSDREAATLEGSAADRAAMLKKAEAMIKDGRGDEIITLQYGFVPLSASRFASLTGRGGPDDVFSSDFTDAELGEKLGHLGGGNVERSSCTAWPTSTCRRTSTCPRWPRGLSPPPAGRRPPRRCWCLRRATHSRRRPTWRRSTSSRRSTGCSAPSNKSSSVFTFSPAHPLL